MRHVFARFRGGYGHVHLTRPQERATRAGVPLCRQAPGTAELRSQWRSGSPHSGSAAPAGRSSRRRRSPTPPASLSRRGRAPTTSTTRAKQFYELEGLGRAEVRALSRCVSAHALLLRADRRQAGPERRPHRAGDDREAVNMDGYITRFKPNLVRAGRHGAAGRAGPPPPRHMARRA